MRAAVAGSVLVSPYISVAFYVAVAIMWLVPDRRFEHGLVKLARAAHRGAHAGERIGRDRAANRRRC